MAAIVNCSRQSLKPWPNDRNIVTEHIATFLGATSCARLNALLGHVAICCDMLGVVGSSLKIVTFFLQHLWMLHDAVLVWPDTCNNFTPGHGH